MVVVGPTRYRAVVPTSRSDGCSWAHPLPRGGYRPLDPMVVAGPTRYRAVVPTSRSDGCTLGPPATARGYRPLDPMVVLWAHPLPRGGTDLSIRWL